MAAVEAKAKAGQTTLTCVGRGENLNDKIRYSDDPRSSILAHFVSQV